LQHHLPLSSPIVQNKLLHCNKTGHYNFQLCSRGCGIATALATLKPKPAVQVAVLPHHWPIKIPTLKYKLLHCNTTGHSQVQPCNTSCCIATSLATLNSNTAVQAAALQQHWPLSGPTLKYKLLH